MAAKEMADYLSNLTADYTAEELTIAAQHTLLETGGKNQEVHTADDVSEERITYSDDSEFVVEYAYAGLTEEEGGTIIDLYHNTSKANGLENTFYWQHPKEANIYTVRFMDVITKTHNGNHGSYVSIKAIKLRVEGNKP